VADQKLDRAVLELRTDGGQTFNVELAGVKKQIQDTGAAADGSGLKIAALGSFIGNFAADALGKLIDLGMRGVRFLATEFIALGKRGADVADVKNSFERLSGGVDIAKGTLASLRTAFGGTIADYDLMVSANEVLRSGTKLTGDEFASLGKASRILADQVGGNAKESFDGMLGAIARGNEKELKQLGFNLANIEKSVDAHAAALGKEASALNQSEKQQALKNAVLAESNRLLKENGETTNDFADNIEAAGAMVQNWKDRLGEAIAKSPELNTALTKVSDAMLAAFGKDPQTQVETISKLVGMAALAAVKAAQIIISAAQWMANAYYTARQAVDNYFKAFNDKSIREVESLMKVYEGAAARGENFAKKRMAELTDRLNYLKGYSQGLEGDASDAAATNTKLNAMAADAQKWLNDLTIAMKQARVEADKHTASASALGQGFQQTGETSEQLTKRVNSVKQSLLEMNAAADLAAKNGSLASWAADNAGAIEKLVVAAASIGSKVTGNVLKAFLLNSMAATNAEAAKFTQDFYEQQAKALDKSLDYNNKRFSESLDAKIKLNTDYANLVDQRTMGSFEYEIEQIKRAEREQIQSFERLGIATEENLELVRRLTADKMAAATKVHNDEFLKMKAAADSWAKRLGVVIGAIPGLLKSALTGGGGIGGFTQALAAEGGEQLIGKGVTDLLSKGFNAARPALGNLLGPTLANAIGTAIPGLGQAIGALAGPLIGSLKKVFTKIFGGTEGRDMVRDFAASFGGFDELHKKLSQELGPDAERFWIMLTQGVGRNNPAQAKAAIDAITKALGEAKEKQAAFNTTLQGFLERVRDLGGSLPDSLRDYLQSLRDGGKLTQDNIALLAELAGNGEADWKKIQEAVGRYNGDISKLGGTFQAQRLHDEWQQLIDDVDLFERGNISAADILDLTKGKILELVQQSLKFGVEIPENMRPFIKNLADAGELVDENGEKITDLGKLKFGETLQTTLQMLVDTVKELIEQFKRIPDVVAGLPKSVDIKVNAKYDGEAPGAGGAIPMAGGGFGRVTTPTLFLAGEAGDEDVAFSGGGRRFGGGLSNMEQTVVVKIGDRVIAQAVARGGPRELVVLGV
jgi:hypothetical protein